MNGAGVAAGCDEGSFGELLDRASQRDDRYRSGGLDYLSVVVEEAGGSSHEDDRESLGVTVGPAWSSTCGPRRSVGAEGAQHLLRACSVRTQMNPLLPAASTLHAGQSCSPRSVAEAASASTARVTFSGLGGNRAPGGCRCLRRRTASAGTDGSAVMTP